jgi:hypothetical protein
MKPEFDSIGLALKISDFTESGEVLLRFTAFEESLGGTPSKKKLTTLLLFPGEHEAITRRNSMMIFNSVLLTNSVLYFFVSTKP